LKQLSRKTIILMVRSSPTPMTNNQDSPSKLKEEGKYNWQDRNKLN